MALTLLLFFTAFAALIYHRVMSKFDHWTSQKVPCEPKPVPVFGHLLPVFLLRDNFGTLLERMYRRMGTGSMRGCFVIHTPGLLIRDPELVKRVLQTDFNSFANNVPSLHEDLDPVLHKNPFFAKYDVWEESRALLVKNQSGGKLKSLLVLVTKVCDQLVKFIDRQVKTEIESKLLFSRVTSEIIANGTFGIDGRSFEDDLGMDAFINLPDRVFNLDKFGGLKQVVRFFLSNFANFMGISVVPRNANNWIIRQLKLADNNNVVEESDVRIAAETSILFDGYEAISNCLTFMFFRIAVNQDVQEKARREILEVLNRFHGRVTSESLKQMTYMDQIINEVLRMHPSFGDISRVCNRNIKLKGHDGLECELRPGDIALVSVRGIHNDEKFWTDPGTFRPERFDSDESSGRHKFMYFGFGGGPRVCPGRRLGIMVVKAVASAVLRNYKVDVSDSEGGRPLRLNKNTFASNVEGGVRLHYSRLSDSL